MALACLVQDFSEVAPSLPSSFFSFPIARRIGSPNLEWYSRLFTASCYSLGSDDLARDLRDVLLRAFMYRDGFPPCATPVVSFLAASSVMTL